MFQITANVSPFQSFSQVVILKALVYMWFVLSRGFSSNGIIFANSIAVL